MTKKISKKKQQCVVILKNITKVRVPLTENQSRLVNVNPDEQKKICLRTTLAAMQANGVLMVFEE